MQEIETLRSKLHGLEHLRDIADGKRARERSESELSSATTSPPDSRYSHSIKKEAKRARDFGSSPPIANQVVSQVEDDDKSCNVSLKKVSHLELLVKATLSFK